MKKDLKKKKDIEKVVYEFYEKVKTDKLLSTFFEETIKINWGNHIPLMCSFWENVLLYTGDYEGNPLIKHREVNEMKATSKVHFDRWILLFENTVDAYFAGENADKMKSHARAIAMLMQKNMR